jgi:hypothetical protein
VVRSSLFATRDIKLIDAIFFDILDGFRGYIGGLGWIRGSKWLLAMVSRVKNQGITASGKMFVEMRERIKKVPESNRKDPGNWPPIKLEPELQELVFSELFPPSVCALSSRGRGKSPQMLRMTMCVNGCDLLLLQKLHFHEIVIARILGLKRTICSDRLFQCSAAVQNARISSSRSQAAPR